MFSLSSIAVFLFVLGVLVIVHEFGHFIVARACGIQVETFSIGFGPKIFSKKYGDTEYCLSLLPLGGYVRMLGDDPTEEVPPESQARAFLTQPLLNKTAVVLAGPGFNLLLALVIFIGLFMVGVPSLAPVVGEVQKDMPAANGGMRPGDRITEVNSDPIKQWEDIQLALQAGDGKTIDIRVMRGDTQVDLRVTPISKTFPDVFGATHPLWVIGIMPKGEHFVTRHDPLTAIFLGARRTWEMTVLTGVGIGKLVTGQLSSDTIGGPILIAQMAGKQAAEGVGPVVLFIAIMSINLGVINLLPIPVLDGGHLFFFLLEAIIGRPISVKIREGAQRIGMAFILSVMVFAFYNDLVRIFVKP